jgi:hypothetical protein
MLSEMDADESTVTDERQRPDVPVADCPQCGFPMLAIRGSKDAVCRNCGFKDSCCY